VDIQQTHPILFDSELLRCIIILFSTRSHAVFPLNILFL